MEGSSNNPHHHFIPTSLPPFPPHPHPHPHPHLHFGAGMIDPQNNQLLLSSPLDQLPPFPPQYSDYGMPGMMDPQNNQLLFSSPLQLPPFPPQYSDFGTAGMMDPQNNQLISPPQLPPFSPFPPHSQFGAGTSTVIDPQINNQVLILGAPPVHPHPNRDGAGPSRKKVKMEWIANDAARRTTFKKRKKGLLKKVEELSILCNVKACAVVYGPNESQPDVWPSVEGAAEMFRKFRSMPEIEQSKNMLNQEAFLRQRIKKTHEQIRRQKKENQELETALVMYQGLKGWSFRGLGKEDMTRVNKMIDSRLKALQDRMEEVDKEMAAAGFPAVGVAPNVTAPPQYLQLTTPQQPALLPPPPVQQTSAAADSNWLLDMKMSPLQQDPFLSGLVQPSPLPPPQSPLGLDVLLEQQLIAEGAMVPYAGETTMMNPVTSMPEPVVRRYEDWAPLDMMNPPPPREQYLFGVEPSPPPPPPPVDNSWMDAYDDPYFPF